MFEEPQALTVQDDLMTDAWAHRVQDVVALGAALANQQSILFDRLSDARLGVDFHRGFSPVAVVKECGSGKTTLGRLLFPALACDSVQMAFTKLFPGMPSETSVLLSLAREKRVVAVYMDLRDCDRCALRERGAAPSKEVARVIRKACPPDWAIDAGHRTVGGICDAIVTAAAAVGRSVFFHIDEIGVLDEDGRDTIASLLSALRGAAKLASTLSRRDRPVRAYSLFTGRHMERPSNPRGESLGHDVMLLELHLLDPAVIARLASVYLSDALGNLTSDEMVELKAVDLAEFAQVVFKYTAGVPRQVIQCIKMLWYRVVSRKGSLSDVQRIVDHVYDVLAYHSIGDIFVEKAQWDNVESKGALVELVYLAETQCPIDADRFVLPVSGVKYSLLRRLFPVFDRPASKERHVVVVMPLFTVRYAVSLNALPETLGHALECGYTDTARLFERMVGDAVRVALPLVWDSEEHVPLREWFQDTAVSLWDVGSVTSIPSGTMPSTSRSAISVAGTVDDVTELLTKMTVNPGDFPQVLASLPRNVCYFPRSKTSGSHDVYLILCDKKTGKLCVIIIQAMSGIDNTVTQSKLVAETAKTIVPEGSECVLLLVSQGGLCPTLTEYHGADTPLVLTAGEWFTANLGSGCVVFAVNEKTTSARLKVCGRTWCLSSVTGSGHDPAIEINSCQYWCQCGDAGSCGLSTLSSSAEPGAMGAEPSRSTRSTRHAATKLVIAAVAFLANVPAGQTVVIPTRASVERVLGKSRLAKLTELQAAPTDLASWQGGFDRIGAA